MVKKRVTLGTKGIEALLAATQEVKGSIEEKKSGLLELEVTQLQPGRYQPRHSMDETQLEQLADSIRSQGIIQPILVRKIKADKYEIIAGERRWRAAQKAGLQRVPVVVKEVSDEKAMAMALIENIQREDLNALEEAHALERLSKEFGLTHEQVAEAVGKSRTTVTNLLRLLTLTEDVKRLLEKGKLAFGHAKVLLGLKSHQQNQAARVIIDKELSVRETEQLVARFTETVSKSKAIKKEVMDPDVKRLQNTLSEKLGATVEIQHKQGKGRVLIHYNSLEELEGILEHLE